MDAGARTIIELFAAGAVRRLMPVGSALAAGLFITAGPLAASDDDMRRQGEAIAAAKCARCHAIGASDPSPQATTPPFRSLYERFPIAMLEVAKETGSISGHDEMPGFDFTPQEARALLGYIDSLAPDKPAYIRPVR